MSRTRSPEGMSLPVIVCEWGALQPPYYRARGVGPPSWERVLESRPHPVPSPGYTTHSRPLAVHTGLDALLY